MNIITVVKVKISKFAPGVKRVRKLILFFSKLRFLNKADFLLNKESRKGDCETY